MSMYNPHFFEVPAMTVATADHPVGYAVTSSLTPEDGPYAMPGNEAGATTLPLAYSPLLSAA